MCLETLFGRGEKVWVEKINFLLFGKESEREKKRKMEEIISPGPTNCCHLILGRNSWVNPVHYVGL